MYIYNNVCPRSSYPFYIVPPWTHSNIYISNPAVTLILPGRLWSNFLQAAESNIVKFTMFNPDHWRLKELTPPPLKKYIYYVYIINLKKKSFPGKTPELTTLSM